MKTKLLILSFILISISLINTSCSKVEGCTDSRAENYDYDADEDDGSCRCTSYITFNNTVNEDYTITSTSGSQYVVNAYGDKTLEVSGVGECYTYTVTDESNGGIYIGSASQCACDSDQTIRIY